MKNISITPKTIKLIVLFSLAFSIVLAVLPNIQSKDVFGYIFRARIHTVYGQNPYIVPPQEFPQDSLFNVSPIWNYLPMPYGPFWSDITIFFNILAKDNMLLNIILYRLLAILLNFGIIYLIWKISLLYSPERRLINIFLFAWNPLLLFETAFNAHNDGLIIFLMLFAFYLLLNNKYLTALTLLIISVLVKFVTIFLFPVFLIYIFRKVKGKKERLILFCASLAILIMLFAAGYLPFWSGLKTFQGIIMQSKVVLLFSNLSFFSSLVFGAFILAKKYFHINGNMIGFIRNVSMAFFLVIYFWQIFMQIKKQEINPIQAGLVVLFSYLFIGASYIQPWYFLWLLTLAILLNKKIYTLFIIIITVLGLTSYSTGALSISLILVSLMLLYLQIICKNKFFTPFFVPYSNKEISRFKEK